MNPWDIAAWAGALTITILCATISITAIVSLVNRNKRKNTHM